LGLAIVKKFIEAHGSRLEIASSAIAVALISAILSMDQAIPQSHKLYI